MRERRGRGVGRFGRVEEESGSAASATRAFAAPPMRAREVAGEKEQSGDFEDVVVYVTQVRLEQLEEQGKTEEDGGNNG